MARGLLALGMRCVRFIPFTGLNDVISSRIW